MISLDGSTGEGGGQILRTALALSLVTGTPFRIHSIRAKREKPGLLRQHLTAVLAAQAIGAAEVSGVALGAQTLSFTPHATSGGARRFAVGTAGSTTLVLQTVLPGLLAAPEPSEIAIEGGTHNMAAPPFEFLAGAFVPLLLRMGARVEVTLWRPGFFPAGGGELRATIEPSPMRPLEITDRGAIRAVRATAFVANLDKDIGRREIDVLVRRLKLPPDAVNVEMVRGSIGPGNAVVVHVESEALTEVFAGFGERGRSAESVAEAVASDVTRYLEAEVPVGEHLADQLLLPLALAGGGTFRTSEPSSHARTNAAVIEQFLPTKVKFEPDGKSWLVTVART